MPQVGKNILSSLLSQCMSGNALTFVGNFYMYLIVFANTSNTDQNIKCPFVTFNSYTNIQNFFIQIQMGI